MKIQLRIQLRNQNPLAKARTRDTKTSLCQTAPADILEVVQSDFEKSLADEEAQESDAASAYEKTTQENKITKATKEGDVKGAVMPLMKQGSTEEVMPQDVLKR